jgi:hypothetical protein
MTEAQLREIETTLDVRLPERYRAACLTLRFRPVGGDVVYWFFDDPARVIQETRYPLEDGEYDQANWKPSYLTIGNSAVGDLYLLDTARGDASPVYCLSHEDHSITEDWPNFRAFVADWYQQGQEQLVAQWDAERETLAKQSRRNWQIMLAFFGLLILFALFVALFVPRP